MKKVINGKLYNTETAKECAIYAPNPYQSDFSWYKETLYQKKTGEFFLHGKGNAASKYSRSCGQNEWCGGESIIPLTYDVAKEWAEKHLEGDEYISIFGEPEEDSSRQIICLSLSKTSIAKLKQRASKSGKSMSEYVEKIIEEGTIVSISKSDT